MPEPPGDAAAPLLTRRKLALQLVGFLVGLGLLAWIIVNAIREGGWSRVAEAPPLLAAGLLACTAVSTLLNGTVFWIMIRTHAGSRLWDMQRLNVVANMLNYAPIRLGAIGRILYHVRVDGLSILQVGAIFAMVGYTLVLGVAACAVATVVHDRIDWIWGLLVAAQLVLGGIAIRVLASHPLIVRYGRGISVMAASPLALWGAIVLRMADLGMYTGRMALAAAILGIELPPSQLAVLALVALMASLIPLGRVGFREFCVAAAGARLSALGGDVAAHMNKLALMESAGEALVFVPAGLLFLHWFRGRFR